jgi:hypothetical protein
MFFDLSKYEGPALLGHPIKLRTRLGEIVLGAVKDVQLQRVQIVINLQESHRGIFHFKINRRRITPFTFIELEERLIINYPFEYLILGVTIHLDSQLSFSA